MPWPHTWNILYCIVIALSCVLAQPIRVSDDKYPDTCERHCSNSCYSPTFYKICQCDSLCELYGDCCSQPSRKACNTTPAESVSHPVFSCQDSNSITISNNNNSPLIMDGSYFWYWMVTVCPDDWVVSGDAIGQELRQAIESMCINATQRLPPVTDMNTGFDYHNEYCAICNRVNPQHVTRWEYEYDCQEDYIELLRSTDNNTLTKEGLEKFCSLKRLKKPSFNLLSTGQPSPPERFCYPMKPPSCLDRESLENFTGVQWNDTMYQTVKAKCFGDTQAPVNDHPNIPFRNKECALCNGIPENEIYYLCTLPRVFALLRPVLSFSVLLDINNDGLILISSDDITTTVQVSCSQTEIYDPVLSACRSIDFEQCIQRTNDGVTSAVLVNGKCITCNTQLLALNDSNSFSYHNSTAVSYENITYAIEYTNAQGQPVICTNISGGAPVLDTACNGSLISLSESDLFSYVAADIVVYGSEEYRVKFNNSRGEPVICVDFSNNGTLLTNTTIQYYGYPIGFYVLTYIGCSLSVIGCFLVLLTYLLFKELRRLPSKILMNLALAILISNILILFGGPVAGAFPQVVELCVAIAILLHYFSLSQFSWMSIMAFEMTRTFYQAHKLRVNETKQSKRIIFTIYFILGWSLPLLISVLTIVVNFTTEGLVLYGMLEDGTQGSCWINHVESAIVAMIVPVVISLTFNAITFVIVILFLIHAYRSQAKVKKMTKSNVSYFRLTVAVFTVSGLSWGFGFIAILTGTSWSWYPFIIFNSIQGFVIFLAFLCTKKVGKLYLSLLMGRRGKKESSVATKQSAVVGTPQKKLDKADKIELAQYDHSTTT